MANAKQNLKILSILVLALAGLSIVRGIIEIFTISYSQLPAGITQGQFFAAQLVVVIVGLIFTLPQIYVGVKGLKVCANPDSSKGHIVWATILFVIALLALISPISSLIKAEGSVMVNLWAVVDTALDAVIFALIVKYAKVLRVK